MLGSTVRHKAFSGSTKAWDQKELVYVMWWHKLLITFIRAVWQI